LETDSQRVIHEETDGQNGGTAATSADTKSKVTKPAPVGNASKQKSTTKRTEQSALKKEQRKAAAAQAAVEDLQRRLAAVEEALAEERQKAAGLGNPRESHSKLAVVISDEILRPHTKGRGFAKLLGSPRVSGRACHTDVEHFARVQFDDEEGEDRTEEKVSHGKKVARPDLLGMSVNACPPGLSMWSCGAHSSHVHLNGSFRNVNAQLEEFASDAFCSPQAVVPCHLLNQGHCLLRDPWLERSCSGLVLPEEFEALTMPSQQCLWLDDEQRLFPGTYYSGQQHKEHAVRLGTGRSFHLATQDDHLLTRASRFLPPVRTYFWQGQSESQAAARWSLVWSRRRSGGGAIEDTALSIA
jgi:hypothetical protein